MTTDAGTTLYVRLDSGDFVAATPQDRLRADGWVICSTCAGKGDCAYCAYGLAPPEWLLEVVALGRKSPGGRAAARTILVKAAGAGPPPVRP